MTPTGPQIRQQFIDFFVEKCGHTFVPSSPTIPHDDPTLLFANAGMNQFKPLFLGQAAPGGALAKLKRAANSQKCIRAGGKHNDLDDVGKDTYHHTFFEMLGNWSFGDYFKKEAIDWAWELLTKVWKIDPERLYATYFEGEKGQGLEPDREAYELWSRHLPAGRILPGNMKDNFWEMGDTGPCGPCSEIHYDGRTDAQRAAEPGWKLVNAGHADVIEIWNLVFIQFNRTEAGLRPLPAKHVDTGMGLERLVRVLQKKNSNYDTDLFTPIFDRIRKITGAPAYAGHMTDKRDVAYRVVADHARTLTFALTDGAVPGNEGRGYVLRRILRRAYRYGRQYLGAPETFLCEIVPTIVEHFGAFFPELKKDPARVAAIIRDEEESFGRTLDRGNALFAEAAQRGGKVISADDAFKLHDTYGFPVDLTQIMAEERGMTVDVAGYERLMAEAKTRSRMGGKAGAADDLTLSGDEVAKLRHMTVDPTDDVDKFHGRPIKARVEAIWNGDDFDQSIEAAATRPTDRFGVVLNKTNYYAEMGGQVGDTGTLRHAAAGGAHGAKPMEFNVEATRSFGGYVLHIGRIESGRLAVGDDLRLEIDDKRRTTIVANHTATHLLNLALRDVLGEGADQRGSLVAPDRLRFDFAAGHAMDEGQAARVESAVRERIARNLAVHSAVVPLEQARKVRGLRAVFGEAYPDPVRVVSIGPAVEELLANPDDPRWAGYSVEFCGGTHVGATGDIGEFVLLSEEAVAKGVRRLSALPGVPAKAANEAGHRLMERLRAAALRADHELGAEVGDILGSMETLTIPASARHSAQRQIAALQERMKSAQKQQAAEGRARAVELARTLADRTTDPVIIARMPAGDRDSLLAALDAVRAKRDQSAVMLLGVDVESKKVTIVAGVPQSLVGRGLKAGEWVKAASEACGGKGGGRPDSAQGGGTQPERVDEAVRAATDYAASKMS
ncbi:MAG: alanine--tRNA ligase [Phycisphaerales bacterium]|nr:alanine--tRNA ligase [Phycisphaerales bacterium]